MLKIFTLAFFCIIPLFSQNFTYNGTIGKFKDASSFYINSAGFIYVTDTASDEVYKLDTLGRILNNYGGYGWNNESFDNPVHVFSTTLNTYVTDYNNHRIQMFDKDLNFISSLQSEQLNSAESKFEYPTASVISPQGDLYLLDSYNKRVLKFDLFGNFISAFGGYDWGEYSLTAPASLSVSSSNNIFVADDDAVFVFDQFGNGITKFTAGEKITAVTAVFNHLTFNSAGKIYFTELSAEPAVIKNLKISGFDLQQPIVSSLIFNNNLYLLLKKRIIIFKRND